MKLKVVKRDGNFESYIHTKILKTLCCCLEPAEDCVSTAEQITEAFTFHLYNREENIITTNEIHIMLKAILSDAGFTRAVEKLHHHHYLRMMKRNRIKVISARVDSIDDAEIFYEIKRFGLAQSWEKYILVKWLMENGRLDSIEARAVASLVEEKILNSGINTVTTSSIKELALIEVTDFKNMQQGCEIRKVKKTRSVTVMPTTSVEIEYENSSEMVMA